MTKQPRLTLLGSRVGKVVDERLRPSPKTAAPAYQSAEWKALPSRFIAERVRSNYKPALLACCSALVPAIKAVRMVAA
jgi:hypothetical protein